MKIKELYEQMAKLKPVIKPIKAIKPVISTYTPPEKPVPHHLPTGCPELDEILHNLRNGLPSKEQRKKAKTKLTYKAK